MGIIKLVAISASLVIGGIGIWMLFSYPHNSTLSSEKESIGDRFKDKLINSDQDKDWKEKLELWKQDIKENKTTVPFKWNKGEQEPTEKQVMQKCEVAYRKTDWNQLKKEDNAVNQDEYWSSIWKYCSIQGGNAPEGWNAKVTN